MTHNASDSARYDEAGMVKPKVTEIPLKTILDSSNESKHLGNGDYLIDTLKQDAHEVQIIKRTDPSQYIPFLMKCSCGVEGRFHAEKSAKDFAEYHFKRHPR